jgi:superfamily II DNA/RNA helicase
MTAEKVSQGVFRVGQLQKVPLLLWFLEQQTGPTLVFTKTKHRADRVSRTLEVRGFTVTVLHANRSLNQRKAALEGFKRGTFRVLVATDIAARGIDVLDIQHVVNFDLPHVPEDYVHRVGRTARADRSGYAWSFASAEEAGQLRDIERLLKKAIPVIPLPDGLPEPISRPPLPPRHQPHPYARHPQQPFRPAQRSFGPPRASAPYGAPQRGPQRPPQARNDDWTPPDTGDVFYIQKKPFRRPASRGGSGGRSWGGPRRPGGFPQGRRSGPPRTS